MLVGSAVHLSLGSVSASTLLHVPSVPLPFLVAVHASQFPVHALSQQTESAQKPLLHCDGRAHAPPRSRSVVHVVPTQRADVPHSQSVAQVVAHEIPAHP